jgi:hypothetical protein
MPKKSKDHKPLTRAALVLREKLAENIYLLMERQFPASKFRTASAREKALAKEAGCSWSTIQRALAPVKAAQRVRRRGSDDDALDGVAIKIDTLADLAVVFGVRPSDLLTPNYAHTHVGTSSHKNSGQDQLHRKSG